MELIEKIKQILGAIGFNSPIIELNYDEQGNILGYISSIDFENTDDEEIQEKIWENLKENLLAQELKLVLGIFNETPFERNNRVFGNNPVQIKHSNIWIHNSRDLTRYWTFFDVRKQGDEYISFFLIINQKANFIKGLSFVYPPDVIEFMDLAQGEIYNELFSNVLNNAEAEIKMHLMFKHDEMDKKAINWKDNIYSYVYTDFHFRPASKKEMFFTEEEIKVIESEFNKIQDCLVKKLAISAINNSRLFNKMRKDL